MNKLNNPAYVRRLSLLCSLTYLASYLTRVNFATVVVAIIDETGWEKSAISAVTTALFIAYGTGQLISGWLGDRMKPNRLMTFGLLSSACLNLLIPFCTTIPQMTVIWGLNGLAQAMMWPPIVRILTSATYQKDYQNATVLVSWGSSVGTILTFIIASACTSYIGWRPVFAIGAGVAVIVAVVWMIGYARIRNYSFSHENISLAADTSAATPAAENNTSPAKFPPMPPLLSALLSVILLSVIIVGALRDSITAWLPSYIAETFSLGSSSALLTSVILPVFTTITYPVVLWYYRRFFSSESACAATIYALSAVSAFALNFIYDINPIISVLLLALISACMHGANFLIIGLLPKRFEKYGNVSAISGLINSFVYIGSSISIWGIAVIAEHYGWTATIITWGVLALCGVALSIFAARGLKKFFD